MRAWIRARISARSFSPWAASLSVLGEMSAALRSPGERGEAARDPGSSVLFAGPRLGLLRKPSGARRFAEYLPSHRLNVRLVSKAPGRAARRFRAACGV